MTSISIKKTNLISELTTALQYAGSTDWDVYVSLDGQIDTRHNTYSNTDWFELLDLCNSSIEDGNGKYPEDDAYDFKGVAEWIVTELDWIPNEIETWNEEKMEFEMTDVQLI